MTDNMDLSSKTKIGLTIKEVMFTIAFFISIASVWMNLNIRIVSIETNNLQIQKDLVELRKEINDNREERIKQIDQLRIENSSAHNAIMEKQDRIIEWFFKK